MRNWLFILAVLCFLSPAGAHHIWIFPDDKDEGRAVAVFSDTLEPDRADLLTKIAHTEYWLLDGAGKELSLDRRQEKNHFVIDVPGKGPRRLAGRCIYGVERYDHRLRRKVDPYLLVYYPQALLGTTEATKTWERLPLQILAKPSDEGIDLEVVFEGKPAAGAELFVLTSGSSTRASHKVNDQGRLTIRTTKPGLYAFRTRHIEAKPGKHQGKEYREVRHYASLVLRRG